MKGEGLGLGAARAEACLPVALSPHVGHTPHLLAVGPLFPLVLPFFLFLFVPTLVTLPAIVTVNKRPLDCLVGPEVIVLAKGSPEPAIEPGVTIAAEHRAHQAPVKIPRHGPQQVAMARHRKPLEADDALAFGAPGK